MTIEQVCVQSESRKLRSFKDTKLINRDHAAEKNTQESLRRIYC